MGKSIFWAFSARTGELLPFKSKFECDVFQMAEMEPNVKNCRLRAFTFTYFDGKRKRNGDFFLLIDKGTGEQELWNPTEEELSLDRPIEKARTVFAEAQCMPYRRIYRGDFYADEIAVMNRRTMIGVLSTYVGKQDTEELEEAVLSTVPAGVSLSLSRISQELTVDMALLRLATFRLCAKGKLAGENRRYICPNWQLRRPS